MVGELKELLRRRIALKPVNMLTDKIYDQRFGNVIKQLAIDQDW